MQGLKETISKLKGKPWVNILILGESGTGKEVVARLLHSQERTSTRPFVAINMAALPTRLFESELFGVERGAYTDATTSRAGKAELAHRGDLFLDEIGDLDADAQAKLLRFLQDRTIQRLGSNQTRTVEVRTISATNKPLGKLIQEGLFREDLLYRLADVTIHLPPLRERREDIELLARHFFDRYRAAYRLPFPQRLNPSAILKLRNYHWPGNVRQLESTIKRALIFADGPDINDITISESFDRPAEIIAPMPVEKPVASAIKGVEKDLIEKALIKHQGNALAAGAELGLPRATIYRKMKLLEINARTLGYTHESSVRQGS